VSRQESSVKLRDKRRPGHCWQDNELYDAWQPIIGPHAVNVYVNLTRDAYSSTIEYSVRRLADATGISRTAVWRNLRVMEHVGMLRLERGSGSAASTCELLDLKEAAEKLGAIYNRRQASFVFTDVKLASLRMEVVLLRKKMQNKGLAVQSDALREKQICVPERDTNSEENSGEEKILCPSKRDASVPPERRLCLSEGGAQHKCEQDTKHNTNPPPTPALPAGVLTARADALRAKELNSTPGDLLRDEKQSHVDDALDHVMRECGFTGSRLRKALREPMRLYMQQYTGRAYHAAEEMIGAWREYCQLGDLVRARWGPRKFFCEGHWLRPQTWPLDRALLERRRLVMVGSR